MKINQLNKLKLFIDKKKRKFVLKEKNIKCEKCSQNIKEIIFITLDLNRKQYKIFLTCNNCLLKIQPTGIQQEYHSLIIIDELLEDFIPYYINPTNQKDSKNNETVLSATNLPSDKTVDKAYRSKHYPSLERASIGKDIKEITYDKDKKISIQEGLTLLDDLAEAKPIIEKSNIKLLEKLKGDIK